MNDGLVSFFSLAISLRMGNGCESHMIAESAQKIYDLGNIELLCVVEDYCMGDAKASDDVLAEELAYLSHGD